MTTQIDTAQGLIEQVLDGSLAAAVVHAASGRPNIVAALLFEEKLVSVRTIPTNVQLSPEDKVEIDWGENFAASYKAVFRDRRTQPYQSVMVHLLSDYILATGGSGYFREGFISSYLTEGRLALVPDSPEFAYSA